MTTDPLHRCETPGRQTAVGCALLWGPCVLLLGALALLVAHCRSLLLAAASGQPAAGGAAAWLPICGFVGACALALAFLAWRIASRVRGPEHRLRLALQRIRSRDVGFRVSLRRDDLLQGLARECNELLDWLNENPPGGARTGSDILDLSTRERRRPVGAP